MNPTVSLIVLGVEKDRLREGPDPDIGKALNGALSTNQIVNDRSCWRSNI